jgi:hypothetical protein
MVRNMSQKKRSAQWFADLIALRVSREPIAVVLPLDPCLWRS